MNTNKNQDKGFTLVELLIVIVILGILATVTVFAVRGITDQGESNACATEKRAVETALEAFYTQNDQTDATADADLIGSYLKTAPTFVSVNYGVTPPEVTKVATVTGDC
jgi:prepilin-type N-terminal cleavage/methylation domain-containing protein